MTNLHVTTGKTIEIAASRRVAARRRHSALGSRQCSCHLGSQANANPTATTSVGILVAYLAAWMSASRLRLNPTKTEVIWLRFKHQVEWTDRHSECAGSVSLKTRKPC